MVASQGALRGIRSVSEGLSGVTGGLYGISGGFRESCGRCQRRSRGVAEDFRKFKRSQRASGDLRGVSWGSGGFRGIFWTLRRVSEVSKKVPEGLRGVSGVPVDLRVVSKKSQEISGAPGTPETI